MDLSEMADLEKYSEAEKLKNEAAQYLDAKDYNSALETINEAIKLAPNYCALYNSRGLIYMEMYDYQRALADFNRAIEMMPSFPLFHLNRAACYFILKEFKKALAGLDEAVKLAPGEPFYLLQRANLYVALKRYDEAIIDCAAAIALNPQSQEAIRELLSVNRQRVRNEIVLDLNITRSRPAVFSRSRADGMTESLIVLPGKQTIN